MPKELKIDQLVRDYAKNPLELRGELEAMLEETEKADAVKAIYREILNGIDDQLIDPKKDLLAIRRQYFLGARSVAFQNFSNVWFVSMEALRTSAAEYKERMDDIPNVQRIVDSANLEQYQLLHPGTTKESYRAELKREWHDMLTEIIVPLAKELKE